MMRRTRHLAVNTWDAHRAKDALGVRHRSLNPVNHPDQPLEVLKAQVVEPAVQQLRLAVHAC